MQVIGINCMYDNLLMVCWCILQVRISEKQLTFSTIVLDHVTSILKRYIIVDIFFIIFSFYSPNQENAQSQ